MMSEGYRKLKEEAQHLEPLEVWTCQRADNLKKKKPKNMSKKMTNTKKKMTKADESR